MSDHGTKPAALVTRRMPASALSMLREVCSVDLHEGNEAIPREDLIERVRGKRALVCLLTDRIDAAVLDAGSEVKIVANVAGGFDNVAFQAASRFEETCRNHTPLNVLNGSYPPRVTWD